MPMHKWCLTESYCDQARELRRGSRVDRGVSIFIVELHLRFIICCAATAYARNYTLRAAGAERQHAPPSIRRLRAYHVPPQRISSSTNIKYLTRRSPIILSFRSRTERHAIPISNLLSIRADPRTAPLSWYLVPFANIQHFQLNATADLLHYLLDVFQQHKNKEQSCTLAPMFLECEQEITFQQFIILQGSAFNEY